MGSVLRIVGKILVSEIYMLFRVTVGVFQLMLLIFAAVMKIVCSIIKMGEHI